MIGFITFMSITIIVLSVLLGGCIAVIIKLLAIIKSNGNDVK